jgi:CheY-like chemotaxis protein
LKPVKQSELKAAIENALAVNPPKREPEVIPVLDEPPPIKPLNILLVEDGLMNQKIALALLEKWGHRVTIANNGREALSETDTQKFDLVLMDVQMPEMDGFEATQVIRAREQKTGEHVPIVAMTARAMMGDREKCLQSGMDSYVAKPIRRRELYGAIAPFFAAQRDGTSQDINISWSKVLQLVNGDRQIIAELIDTYRIEVPKLVASIENAARALDAKALRLAAHTLKGSMRLFGVASVSSLVEAIESQGESGVLENLQPRIDELKLQLKRLDQALDSFKP